MRNLVSYLMNILVDEQNDKVYDNLSLLNTYQLSFKKYKNLFLKPVLFLISLYSFISKLKVPA